MDPSFSTESSIAGANSETTTRLLRSIEQAAALLPSQGPITAFVFLNTLQALETLPFDEGVQKGARLFGCEPYLREQVYREKLIQDRIHLADLALSLRRDLKDHADKIVAGLSTRHALRLAMLQYNLRTAPTEELRWFVAETDALKKIRPDAPSSLREKFLIDTKHWVMRDLRIRGRNSGQDGSNGVNQHLPVEALIERFGRSSIEEWSPATWEAFSLQALWRVCRNGIFGVAPAVESAPPPHRHRDFLLQATQFDTDSLVHPVLIRFCAAFADQGFANWSLPYRDAGLFASFLKIYQQPHGPPDEWITALPAELTRIQQSKITPTESMLESLELLGVPPEEWDDYLVETLLALRGWAGLIRQLEVRPDRQAISALPGSLVEFLAVRLILERLALRYVAKASLNFTGPLCDLRMVASTRIQRLTVPSVEQRAFQIFQLAQVLGWSPHALNRLKPHDWSELIHEMEVFTSMERRRIFHQAFERHLRAQTLDAIHVHCRTRRERVASPRFQSVYCIDTREESFRRHLEEVCPEAETFGVAGFFNISMYYKGVADAHFAALCPIVIRPRHWITEEVDAALEAQNLRRAKTRKVLGRASHNMHVRSRSITGGALLTASFGVLASIPLVARVLFPRLVSRIRRQASRFVEPPEATRLHLERKSPVPSPSADGIGFTVEEMATIGERILRDIGLTSNFAPIVIFFGHGSDCLNNPHKSCYDCGACSGGAGAPNARALAAMLNDHRVRDLIRRNGVTIPADTRFIGGLHNTCNDTLTFYDCDRIPEALRGDFEFAKRKLDETCERNAHERCRRFRSAPLDLSFAAAHRHVEGRAEDLAQTRPEFGNASNAICFVGRRERLRGLFLDRRCFLQSYDPDSDDDDCQILGRILSAVVPVCSGINLQYFFSAIDSPGWGCGTKLPHNITSLMGVMDGSSSDLRTGLPWQGVEIHEPVRLLTLIETTPDRIRKIMARSEVVRNIVHNGWIQLALLEKDSNSILVYRGDEFHQYDPGIEELPKAKSSVDWYRGWRDHLGFAQIEA